MPQLKVNALVAADAYARKNDEDKAPEKPRLNDNQAEIARRHIEVRNAELAAAESVAFSHIFRHCFR